MSRISTGSLLVTDMIRVVTGLQSTVFTRSRTGTILWLGGQSTLGVATIRVITGDVPMSVQAMKAGAVEFLTKPFDDAVLLNAIRQGDPQAAEQLLPLVYDDLCKDPQSFVDQVADFVGTPRFTLTMSQRLWVHASEAMTHPWNYQTTRSASSIADWCKAHRLDRLVAAVRNSPLKKIFLGSGTPFKDVPEEVLSKLSDLFRPEVEELEILLQRNLSAWRAAG